MTKSNHFHSPGHHLWPHRCPKKPPGKAKALTNPSAHFVRDAAYVFAHALHNIWEKVFVLFVFSSYHCVELFKSSGLQFPAWCLCRLPWGGYNFLSSQEHCWSSAIQHCHISYRHFLRVLLISHVDFIVMIMIIINIIIIIIARLPTLTWLISWGMSPSRYPLPTDDNNPEIF